MKGKTKLRVIQILCIVSLLITVFSIQTTYAKYYEKIGTTYATNIKRWMINVNTEDIHEGITLSEIMQPQFVADTHMNNNNTLVPGRKGFFEFLIDYSKVDVPFKYEFDINQLNVKTVGEGASATQIENHLEDFQIYGYSIVDNGTVTETELSEPNKLDEITQFIDPNNEDHLNSSGEKSRLIRVLFEWYDEDDNEMDNLEDTQYAGEDFAADELHTLLNYNVKITFTQTI